jgi:probable rRNA maturation factor
MKNTAPKAARLPPKGRNLPARSPWPRLALTLGNRQASRPADLPFLRRMLKSLLQDLLRQPVADLGVYLVGARDMTRFNERFLRHAGSTDVITFDYSSQTPGGPGSATHEPAGPGLHGEIFICVDEAVLQAARFRTTWTAEVVRYAVHGILHLRGFDDARTLDRQRMKHEESRLLGELAGRFDLAKLARRPSRKQGGLKLGREPGFVPPRRKKLAPA